MLLTKLNNISIIIHLKKKSQFNFTLVCAHTKRILISSKAGQTTTSGEWLSKKNNKECLQLRYEYFLKRNVIPSLGTESQYLAVHKQEKVKAKFLTLFIPLFQGNKYFLYIFIQVY